MSAPTITEKSLKSLHPTGEIAWRGMSAGTTREISDGLAAEAERNRQNGKSILTDFSPYLTTLQKEWEETFRLPSGELLTQDQRTARLIEAWVKTDPGSFDGMNEIYLLSGLDVVARPLVPGEDPRVIATDPSANILADGRPGDVNINYITVTGASRTGNVSASSRCGSFEGSRIDLPVLTIPDETWTWSLIYVLEDKNGGPAFILEDQLESFLFLTYKNKPQFMWAIAKYETYTEFFNLINDDGENLVNGDGENLIELN